MMTPKRIVGLVLAVLVITPLGLFAWENHATRVNAIFKLSSNLAWDLGPDGMSLPALLAIAFGSGALLVALIASFALMAGSRSNRSLTRQVASLEDEVAFNRGSRATPKPAASSASDLDDLI